MSSRSVDGREGPLTEAGASEAPVPDRVQALHELVRRAVLAELEPSVQRAVDALVRPGLEPDRHAILDVLERGVESRGAAHEEREAGRDEERAARRRIEHREEDPEVEECAAEVVRLDDHEHGGAPDHEQRSEVLEPALGDDLPFLAQVAGEEEDQADLRELAGLKLERSEVHPQAHAVDALAEPGNGGQQQKRDGSDAEEVAVGLENR